MDDKRKFMTNNYIEVLELHFSNQCTGNCVICSTAHGGDHVNSVTEEVIDKIIENLKPGIFQVRTKVIQVGGDGDSFLNPIFLDSLRKIRKEIPNTYICLYSNFNSFTPEMTDIILKENLLDETQTRIDSLSPYLYNLSTGLDLNIIFKNIKYFISQNDKMDFSVVYFPLFEYSKICQKILKKEPAYLNKNKFKKFLIDEYENFRKYFLSLPRKKDFMIRKSDVCLWAERADCKPNYKSQCRQLPENEGAFLWQCLIYPNGDIGLCCYDDYQDKFILGNILKDRLVQVWNSKKRWQLMNDIRQGKFRGKYPCTNPDACRMHKVK